MQSSPPVRRIERPQSPESHYSIDLAALDTDSRSGASSPRLPTQQIDRVLSEDIDGPSDFTQDMEKWMRQTGTINSRPGTLKSGLHLLQEEGNGDPGARDCALKTKQRTEGGDETHSASHHTPTGTPPKESVFASSRQDLDSPAASPEWNPYVDDCTPQPPPHRQFLQPTVEEYHSELTPARDVSTHMKQTSLPQRPIVEETEQVVEDSEPPSPGRPSSETISPAHSPVFQRIAARQFSSQSEEASFERQLKQLGDRCQQLEHLNRALNNAIDEERRLRQHDRNLHELAVEALKKRERELAEKNQKAHAEKDCLQRALDALQWQVRNSEADLERLKHDHAKEVKTLKQRMFQEKEEHEQELEAMEQDLQLAGQSRDDAEEGMRTAQDDLARYKKSQDKTSQQDFDLCTRVTELQDQLTSSNVALQRTKDAKKVADDIADSLRAELSLMRQTQSEETARLTGDHHRAVDLAGDLQAQLDEARKQLHDQKIVHHAELTRLANDPDRISMITHPDNDRANGELAAKQAELNTVIVERDALQDELDVAREEASEATSMLTTAQQDLITRQLALDQAKKELDDANLELSRIRATLNTKEAISNAFDAKVTSTLKRRESHWREKIRALEEKNKIMGKMLMREWGRQECGPPTIIDGKEYQPYRYKFIKPGDRTHTTIHFDDDDQENNTQPKTKGSPAVLNEASLRKLRKETGPKDKEAQHKPRKAPLKTSGQPRATATAKAEARARLRAKELAESVLGYGD